MVLSVRLEFQVVRISFRDFGIYIYYLVQSFLTN